MPGPRVGDGGSDAGAPAPCRPGCGSVVAAVADYSPGRVRTCRPALPLVLRAHPVAGPAPDQVDVVEARDVPSARGRPKGRARARVDNRPAGRRAPVPVDPQVRAPANLLDPVTAGRPPPARARRAHPSAMARRPATRAPAPVHRRAPARPAVPRPDAVPPTPATPVTIVAAGHRSPVRAGAVSPDVALRSSEMASITARTRTPPKVGDGRGNAPTSSCPRSSSVSMTGPDLRPIGYARQPTVLYVSPTSCRPTSHRSWPPRLAPTGTSCAPASPSA